MTSKLTVHYHLPGMLAHPSVRLSASLAAENLAQMHEVLISEEKAEEMDITRDDITGLRYPRGSAGFLRVEDEKRMGSAVPVPTELDSPSAEQGVKLSYQKSQKR